MSGLLALALATACSEEADPTPPLTGSDSGILVQDSGVATDSGAGLDASQCLTTAFGTGAPCTIPGNNTPAYRMCTNGVPVGECMPLLPEGGLGSLFADGGLSGLLGDSSLGGLLGDSGLGIGLNDGSITLGDSSITLPEAGTIKCPTGLECSQIGAAIGLPISACAAPGAGIPGAGDCTMGSGPCKLNGASGTCMNLLINVCLIPCN
jgi:hypothetical protein